MCRQPIPDQLRTIYMERSPVIRYYLCEHRGEFAIYICAFIRMAADKDPSQKQKGRNLIKFVRIAQRSSVAPCTTPMRGH